MGNELNSYVCGQTGMRMRSQTDVVFLGHACINDKICGALRVTNLQDALNAVEIAYKFKVIERAVGEYHGKKG